MYEDAEAAKRMLARLSGLLRLTLENIGAQEVPLQQELAFLERYLEIEQIRQHLYGAVHRLELRNVADGGLLVRLTIPFRPETAMSLNK
jgi:sensor histidine kinase YesM